MKAKYLLVAAVVSAIFATQLALAEEPAADAGPQHNTHQEAIKANREKIREARKAIREERRQRRSERRQERQERRKAKLGH